MTYTSILEQHQGLYAPRFEKLLFKIFQNMDEHNERYVMGLFMSLLEQTSQSLSMDVDSTSGTSSPLRLSQSQMIARNSYSYTTFPQTLLISPTLLRGLQYTDDDSMTDALSTNEDVDYHIIYYGPQISTSSSCMFFPLCLYG